MKREISILVFILFTACTSGCAGSLVLHAGFLWLWQAGCTLWLHCRDFSLLWLLLLRSTGGASRLQWLWQHRPSRPPAYEIFLDQGLNPCPQLWQVYSWPLHHQGNPTYFFKADRHQKHHKIQSMMALQFLWFGYKWLCIYTSRLVSFQLSKVCKWGLGLTEDVHCYDLISGLKAQYFRFCFFFIQVAWTPYRPQDLPAKYNHDLESWFHSS